MACRLTELVLDCRDPRGLAEFWCAVLDYVVLTEEDDGAIEIGPASGPGGPVPSIVLSPSSSMPVTGGNVCRSTPRPTCAPNALANGTIHGAPERFSAPLACQRCCQLFPGWACSQLSTASTPSRRVCWLAGLSNLNGAVSTRPSTAERLASVAGHDDATRRGGNPANSCAPVGFTS